MVVWVTSDVRLRALPVYLVTLPRTVSRSPVPRSGEVAAMVWAAAVTEGNASVTVAPVAPM